MYGIYGLALANVCDPVQAMLDETCVYEVDSITGGCRMHEELAEATRLIDELVGLEHFEVVQMPSKSKGAGSMGPVTPRA